MHVEASARARIGVLYLVSGLKIALSVSVALARTVSLWIQWN